MSFIKILLVILLLRLSVFSQTTFENGIISFNYKLIPLSSVLDDINIKTGVNFIYSDELIRNCRVSCTVIKSSVEKAIKNLLSLSNLNCKKYNGNDYVLFRSIEPTKKPHGTIVTQSIDSTKINSEITITNPELISKGDPFYPLDALKNNVEGKVGVKLFIDNDGKVIRSLVEKSSGYSVLDNAAMEYSSRLKFTPAIVNNKPINIWVSMVFDYKVN